ncbi:MAG: hypothetical protein ACI8Q6_001967 [Granulosicoccus sp.]|jgi:hypothetical protein
MVNLLFLAVDGQMSGFLCGLLGCGFAKLQSAVAARLPVALFPKWFDCFVQSGNGETHGLGAFAERCKPNQQIVAKQQFPDNWNASATGPQTKSFVIGAVVKIFGFCFLIVNTILDIYISAMARCDMAIGADIERRFIFHTPDYQIGLHGGAKLIAGQYFVRTECQKNVSGIFEFCFFGSDAPIPSGSRFNLRGYGPPACLVVTGQTIHIVIDRSAFLCHGGTAQETCGDGYCILSHNFHFLFAWPSQKGCKAKDYVADYPNEQQEAGSQSCTNSSACLFSIAGCLIHELTDAGKVRDKPGNHGNVEKNQQPLEDESKETAPRFAQWVPAMRAVKRLWRNILGAGWASFGCHCASQSNYLVCFVRIDHRIADLSSIQAVAAEKHIYRSIGLSFS